MHTVSGRCLRRRRHRGRSEADQWRCAHRGRGALDHCASLAV